MRDYGQIQCALWTHPDFVGLTDQGKVLLCYLLTGQHSNGLGCYRLPEGYMASDLGWTEKKAIETLSELFQEGFIKRCEVTKFVLIPKYLKWNPVSNPKVGQAREKEFSMLPSKFSYFQELAVDVLRYCNHLSEPFINRLETLSKQEPNRTEPEPNQNQSEPQPRAAPADRFDDWYSAYPKKKGRKAALATWKNKRLDEKADELIADVQFRLGSDRQWIEGYIPHASTYLSQEVWNDDIERPTNKPRPAGRDVEDHNRTVSDTWAAKMRQQEQEALTHESN